MKSNKGKNLIIAGAASLLFLPALLMVTVGLLFPDFPAEFAFVFFYIPAVVSELMIIFGVAIRRAENDGNMQRNVLKLLTPAQIFLLLSSILFAVAVLFFPANFKSIGAILFIVSFVTFVLSVIFFIRGAVNKKKVKNMRTAHRNRLRSHGSTKYQDVQNNMPGKQNIPQTVSCSNCGTVMTNDGTLLHVGTEYYCQSCYAALVEKSRDMAMTNLVNVLNSIAVKKMTAEERKRLEQERLYHTVCSSCGRDFPKSDMHIVDGEFLCHSCFERRFSFDSPAVDKTMGKFDGFRKNNEQSNMSGAVPDTVFDYYTFRKNYRSYIAAHLPKDIESVNTQRTLLEELQNTIPSVKELLLDGGELRNMERGELDSEMGIKQIALRIDRIVETLVLPNIENEWKNLSNNQLLDAFLLLDYYCFMLNPEASVHIRDARDRIGLILQKCLSSSTLTPENPVRKD